MSTSTITFRCRHCGSEKFIKPKNPKPNDTVTCAKCKRTAKFADLQEAAIKQVKDVVTKAFSGIKWK